MLTVSRDLSNIVSMAAIDPLEPLCVPLGFSNDFADEIINKKRVCSLWERLGLVYLEDGDDAKLPTQETVIVNNFFQQLIFRVFSMTSENKTVFENVPASLKKIFDSVSKRREAEIRRMDLSVKIGASFLKQLNTALGLLSEKTEGSALVVSEKDLEKQILSVISELENTETEGEVLPVYNNELKEQLTTVLRELENTETEGEILPVYTNELKEQLTTVLRELESTETKGEVLPVYNNELKEQLTTVLRELENTETTGEVLPVYANELKEQLTMVLRELENTETEGEVLPVYTNELKEQLTTVLRELENTETTGEILPVYKNELKEQLTTVLRELENTETKGEVLPVYKNELKEQLTTVLRELENTETTGEILPVYKNELKEQLTTVLRELESTETTGEVLPVYANELKEQLTTVLRELESTETEGEVLPVYKNELKEQLTTVLRELENTETTGEVLPVYKNELKEQLTTVLRELENTETRELVKNENVLKSAIKAKLYELKNKLSADGTKTELSEKSDILSPILHLLKLRGEYVPEISESASEKAVEIMLLAKNADDIENGKLNAVLELAGIRPDSLLLTEKYIRENSFEQKAAGVVVPQKFVMLVSNIYTDLYRTLYSENASNTVAQSEALKWLGVELTDISETMPEKNMQGIIKNEFRSFPVRAQAHNAIGRYGKAISSELKRHIALYLKQSSFSFNTEPNDTVFPVKETLSDSFSEIRKFVSENMEDNASEKDIMHDNVGLNVKDISQNTFFNKIDIEQDITSQNADIFRRGEVNEFNTENNFGSQNSSSNIQNITMNTTENISGEILPAEENYLNNAEINEFKTENNFGSQSSSSKIQNVGMNTTENISGEVLPAVKNYLNNAEINEFKTENNFGSQNSFSNIQNVGMNTTENISGEVLPAEKSYLNNAEINEFKTENNFGSQSSSADIQNVGINTTENISGEILPAEENYLNNVEINEFKIENNFGSQNNSSNIQNIGINTTENISGEVLPAVKNYLNNAEINELKIENNFGSQNNSSNIQNVGINTTENISGEVLPAEKSYLNNAEINEFKTENNFGSQSSSADIQNVGINTTENISGEVLPAEKGYLSNAEINELKIENNFGSQNSSADIQNVGMNTTENISGEVLPAEENYLSNAEINEFKTENNFGSQSSSSEIQNVGMNTTENISGEVLPAEKNYLSNAEISELNVNYNAENNITEQYAVTQHSERTYDKVGNVIESGYAPKTVHLSYENAYGTTGNTAESRTESEIFKDRALQQDRSGNSFRNRLDKRTSQELDRLIELAESAVKDVKINDNAKLNGSVENDTAREFFKPLSPVYNENVSENTSLSHNELRSISISEKSRENMTRVKTDMKYLKDFDTNIGRTVQKLSKQTENIFSHIFSDRNEMTFLVPQDNSEPFREINAFTARNEPSMEFKRERERAEFPLPKKPSAIMKDQTKVMKPVITGGIEGLSRDQINKLADKVYAQIETRILRERRRAGL